MKNILFLLFFTLNVVWTTCAQENNYWTIPPATSEGYLPDEKFFQLDLKAFKAAVESTQIIIFPNVEGAFRHFHIIENPALAPELAANYPGIHSYTGQGIDDPSATITFSLSDAGLSGTIVSADRKTTFIKPADMNGRYRVFYEREVKSSFKCDTPIRPQKKTSSRKSD